PADLAVPQGRSGVRPPQAQRPVRNQSGRQLRKHSCVRRTRVAVLHTPSTLFGGRGSRGFVSVEAEDVWLRHHAEPALRLLARASRGSGQWTGTWAPGAGASRRGTGRTRRWSW